ncbi:MAG: DUF1080 domain-containing protein [Verrucomicrobia bacterium]|nr:DUF1080 domain-containing protein [Verrucomicrobiota bacterium]
MRNIYCLSIVGALAMLWLAGCAEPACCCKSTPAQSAVPATPPPSPPPAKAEPVPAAKAVPAAANADGWRSLFDGKTLTGWQEADFAGRGPVTVTNGEIVLRTGYMTGIVWTNTHDLLRMNYEIELEAKRTEGSDFFSTLTFPVGTNPCSLVVGGWGGGLVGLSCLDGEDAANNETSKTVEFKQNQWYHVRVQVLPEKILAWIDDEKLVDVVTTDRRVGIRLECEPCLPLGVATWSTTGVLRNIRVRPLPEGGK